MSFKGAEVEMSGVFISYRRSDSRGSAGRIYDNLEAHLGRDLVFRDLDALEPGAEYKEAIETFISSCDAVVAVMGNAWLEARNERGQRRIDDPGDLVRREIEAAFAQNKLVIPVLVEDAVMPDPSELPGSLAALTSRNALPISDARWDYDVGRLVQTLERALGSGPPPRTPERAGRAPNAAGSTSDPGRRPTRITSVRTIGLIALGMVLAVVLSAMLFGGGSDGGGDPTESDTSGETQPADSEETEPAIAFSTDSASPEEDVAIGGSGFQAGETVTISSGEEVLAEATADDDGAFDDVVFTVPDHAESGEFEVEAIGDESGLSATEYLEIP